MPTLFPAAISSWLNRDDLIACCEYYLAHPDEAEAIARAANDFIRTHLRQSQMCADFVKALQSGPKGKHISAINDAPPHAMPKPLARVLARTTARTALASLRSGLGKPNDATGNFSSRAFSGAGYFRTGACATAA